MSLRYKYYDIKTGVKKAKTRLAIAVSALGVGAAGIFGAASILGTAHATSTPVTVTAANPQGWAFFDDNGNGGSGSFVTGPGTPPLGVGSAQLALTASTQGYALGNSLDGDTALSSITSLSYSTYVQTGNNTVAPALQLNIDSDLTDTNTAWQGRLVYEPYYTHSVTDGIWQTWNTQDNATNGSVGNWWFSNGSLASLTGCSQAAPCTWNDVLSKLPNAGISATAPGVIFKAGSNWATPFTGNVDALTIGISGNDTTYNFELNAQVKVQIFKYIDGVQATADNANSAAFPMLTTFTSPNLGNATDAPFTLSPTPWSGIGQPYEADFIGSVAGADYTAHEVTTGNNVVGASCSDGEPFALQGYTFGDTLEQAQNATMTTTAPTFTNLQSDQVMLVWNRTCPQARSITNIDQCKNGGWSQYFNPTFKNQGNCVSWVQHNINGNGTPAATKPSH